MVELIAHRAGNSREAFEPFRSTGDGVEIDVHLHHGELIVRHAKRIWFTARLWDRWFLLPPETEAPLFDDAMEWIDPDVGLWIDCKGVRPRLAEEVVDAVSGRSITLSSKAWWVVRRVAGRPNVRTFRSVGNRFELLLLRLLRSAADIDGVVMHSRLVSAEMVARLHREGRLVVSWSIETEEVGRRLIGLGIDGLIIDSASVADRLRESVDGEN